MPAHRVNTHSAINAKPFCPKKLPVKRNSLKPVSQRLPVNPGAQSHAKPFMPSTHLPRFRHGRVKHSSTSKHDNVMRKALQV